MSRNIVINAQLLHPRFCRTQHISKCDGGVRIRRLHMVPVRKICHSLHRDDNVEVTQRIGKSPCVMGVEKISEVWIDVPFCGNQEMQNLFSN